MGTEIIDNEKITIKRFWGGIQRGTCYSLTVKDSRRYTEFRKDELFQIVLRLLHELNWTEGLKGSERS